MDQVGFEDGLKVLVELMFYWNLCLFSLPDQTLVLPKISILGQGSSYSKGRRGCHHSRYLQGS